MARLIKNTASKINHNRKYIHAKAMGTLGFCASSAVNPQGTPEYLQVIELDLPIPNLPAELHGKRIVHISDLHCSTTVSSTYLSRCIDRINKLNPDIVCLTGDYITNDFTGKFRDKIVELLSDLKNNSAVVACLGNHDYGPTGSFGAANTTALDKMVDRMHATGIKLLRNDSESVELAGKNIRFVGLGDLWTGDMQPEKAFQKACDSDTIITLAHNPESLNRLKHYPSDIILSGHTHGVRFVLKPHRRGLKIQKRPYLDGFYEVDGKRMYVNRGLGRLGRAFFNPPPEITLFTLKKAAYSS